MPQGKQRIKKFPARHIDAEVTMRCPYCGDNLQVERSREATMIQHYKFYSICAEDHRRDLAEQYRQRNLSPLRTHGATS